MISTPQTAWKGRLSLFKAKQTTLREEFSAYVREHQQDFYRLAYSYVKNRENALDIVQEAVVKALGNLGSLKNPAYFKTWFYRILVNESLLFLRKNKRLVLSDEGFADIVYLDRDIPQAIDLYRAIGKLEPQLKTVVILKYFEDMTFEQIAQVTEGNLSTVKSRLYRALQLLKPLIEESVS